MKKGSQKGLLKNAHILNGTKRLLCCAANRTAQRISIHVAFRLYASRFGFLRALHLNIRYQVRDKLLNNPQTWGYSSNTPLVIIPLQVSASNKNGINGLL
jgi:hypothetical protein